MITASASSDKCQFLVQCTKRGCGRKYYLEGHCPKHGMDYTGYRVLKVIHSRTAHRRQCRKIIDAKEKKQSLKTVKLIPALKAQLFVRHIQRHLKEGEYGSLYFTEGRHIPAGKVGCKICERSIDAIFKLEKIIDAKGAEKK